MSAVAFVLGRPPGSGSVLPAVLTMLAARGLRVSVDIVGQRAPVGLPSRWAAADLLVPRGLGLPVLELLATLAGVEACNTVGATLAARDKTTARGRLLAAGVPLPDAVVADRWDAVRAFGADRPVVVKAVAGSRGRGVLVTDRAGSLPPCPPFDGPWITEEKIPGDGRDRKLYVIGSAVRGVLRTWPPRTLSDKRGTTFDPTPQQAALADRAAAALGLTLAGVDVIHGPQGPVVVDINAFPGFKGVAQAARLLTDHLSACAHAPASAGADPAGAVAPCAW